MAVGTAIHFPIRQNSLIKIDFVNKISEIPMNNSISLTKQIVLSGIYNLHLWIKSYY
jgi:hypothetical protein